MDQNQGILYSSSAENLLSPIDGSATHQEPAIFSFKDKSISWGPTLFQYIKSSPVKFCKDTFLFILAFWGLITIVQQFTKTFARSQNDGHNKTSHCPLSACGSSIAEALSLGCKYDSLSVAWLPEHCRDDELIAEFDQAGPGINGSWTYWADQNYTRPLTLLEAAQLFESGANFQGRLFMPSHWHFVHCIFIWRQQYRIRFSGKKMMPFFDSEEHIKHCWRVMENNDRVT